MKLKTLWDNSWLKRINLVDGVVIVFIGIFILGFFKSKLTKCPVCEVCKDCTQIEKVIAEKEKVIAEKEKVVAEKEKVVAEKEKVFDKQAQEITKDILYDLYLGITK